MKTTNLLIPVIGFDSDSYKHAEKLCDLLALYKNRNKSGYILIVAAPNTHPEQHNSVKIAAEIGFSHVELLTVGWPPADPKNPRPEKYEQVNRLFREAATHIAKHFKEPFVWLEPDSIPTCADWLEQLSEAYHEQPKLYMAPILAGSSGKCIGRVAVYPRGCATDIGKHFDSKSDFVVAAGESLVNKASKTKLIQHLVLERGEDLEKVRPDAVIVHGDKKGILLSAMLNDSFVVQPIETTPPEALTMKALNDFSEAIGMKRYQSVDGELAEVDPSQSTSRPNPLWVTPPPSTVIGVETNLETGASNAIRTEPEPKIDKRSKAYRDSQKAALAPA